MIRFFLKERISDLEFRLGRRVTLDEVSKTTGIHRTTLSKIANKKGYNCTTDNLGKLCDYFDCRIEDLVEYLQDSTNANQ